MVRLRATQNHSICLMMKNCKIVVLIIYIDDMTVTGDDVDEMTKLKTYLSSEFDMQDLGGSKYFMGIEVIWSIQGIFLCKRKMFLIC